MPSGHGGANPGNRRDQRRDDGRIAHTKAILVSISGDENKMVKKKKVTPVRWANCVVALSLLAITSAAASDRHLNTLADHVRTANDRFKNVSVALAEGYAPIPCASGVDGGAMGVHYVNAKLLNAGSIDIDHPQAVMYEPTLDGNMNLIAVEYIASKGPASLEGHLFNFTGAPNRYGLGPFYELHVWAWKQTPRGTYSDMNPNVSCEHAH
jgi:hypothetical protein